MLVAADRRSLVRWLVRSTRTGGRRVTAYFANSNGIFVGDEVRILGVPVGKIDSIEPQPERVKITFWFDDQYKVPADAKAVILSPSSGHARGHSADAGLHGWPAVHDGAVIPQDRTAVPVEWDDLRRQLQKLTDMLQPTQPGGVSTLGSFVNTAADNLRGQGADIRDTIIKLSQAFSALGDHSNDIFSTVKNLSILVSALQASTDLMRQLNQNLAAVTGLLADDPNEVGDAVAAINAVVGDVQSFVAENREALGATSDKLASVSHDAEREPRRHQADPAHRADRAAELHQHLPAGAGHADRRAGDQQLRQPDQLPLRGDSGGVEAGRRTVGEAVCAVSGADHQEPSVQLPAAGREPVRRRHRSAQRGHLQRGLDAPRLRSAAPADRDRPRLPAPVTVRPIGPAAGACDDQPGRRSARHDGAARRWIMTSRARRRGALALDCWSCWPGRGWPAAVGAG